MQKEGNIRNRTIIETFKLLNLDTVEKRAIFQPQFNYSVDDSKKSKLLTVRSCKTLKTD